jgi:hypothetical protein
MAPRKRPWRLSPMQKARQRKRLRLVDRVVDTVNAALQKNGMASKAIDRWYAEMPREEEMLPKDKYTIFDRKEKTYRKGIHSMLLDSPCLSPFELLIAHRITEMDSLKSTCQPSWLLIEAIFQHDT